MVHMIRHGQTEMNVFLKGYYDVHGYGAHLSPADDPLLFDTRLTKDGEAQAERLNSQFISKLSPRPELLIVSPLARALQTADLAFMDVMPDVPRLIVPEAAEKVWHSSDIGTDPQSLSSAYPNYDFSQLEERWWYNGNSTNRDPRNIVEEPYDVFFDRIGRLYDIIASRPERSIALVAHWGTLLALTGKEFENCELWSAPLSSFAGQGATRAIAGKALLKN